MQMLQTQHNRSRTTWLGVGVGMALLTAALGSTPVGAYEAGAGHPAHIHNGTCETLGDVAFPLTDVGPEMMMDGTPMSVGEIMGAASAVPVEMSATTVDAKLADIVGGDHAINIHESAENIDKYIACGDIGGAIVIGPGMDQGGTLLIGLRELNQSGYSGIAVLEGKGAQTEVFVYLAEGLSAGAKTMDATASDTVAVTLSEFSIQASQTTFEAGKTYTFDVTNAGTVNHEMVIEPADVVDQPLDNGGHPAEVADLAPGKQGTLTFTFTEPGKYQIACHEPGHYQHGMELTIEVAPAA
jgi:uncharacterized cupredoxin-like copper-binding protein